MIYIFFHRFFILLNEVVQSCFNIIACFLIVHLFYLEPRALILTACVCPKPCQFSTDFSSWEYRFLIDALMSFQILFLYI